MDLSIICPALNEIKYIDSLIEHLCAEDNLEKEIFIVDGGSTDGTRERVKELAKIYPSLRFVDNPMKTSTHAFNVGYKLATGKNIAFVGAHALYPRNYFSTGIKCLQRGECEVIGGPLRQEGKTAKGMAIAKVMSSKAGVGNTEFRTATKKQFTDSVAFAIYKREVFEKCGVMDETLPVNQDDEFHYRIRKMGMRILMVPEMQATYFVRDSYTQLFRQYFRYGLYKPAVLKKVRGAGRLRHYIPAFFTIYIVTLPLAFLFSWWLIPLLIYALLIIYISVKFDSSAKIKLLAIPVFTILHIAYGSGFILGIFKNGNTVVK